MTTTKRSGATKKMAKSRVGVFTSGANFDIQPWSLSDALEQGKRKRKRAIEKHERYPVGSSRSVLL